MGRVYAVIAAGGRGRRVGADRNKVLLPLAGRPVLAHTLAAFEAAGAVDAVVLVAAAEDLDRCGHLVAEAGFGKVEAVVPGGPERQDSVARGLEAVGADADVVVVHDGARPLVTAEVIAAAVDGARRWGAVAAAMPVRDTVKIVDAGGVVVSTPDRDRLWAAQTPQAFRAALLREAYEWAARSGYRGTDEASLVEAAGFRVMVIPGREDNIKITTAADFRVAEAYLALREGDGAGAPAVTVGFGFDVHRLVAGRPLVLGGVEVPFPLGLEGHSDADVLVHALMDALLGAAGLGDIGRLFPDTDERYRGISSISLLEQVAAELRRAGWRPGHVDVTVVAERPRIAPHVPAMISRVAAALGMPAERVSIKGTTTEGLGFAGRGEGIAAYAVAVLRRDR